MAHKQEGISLKALVDKKKNRVIFAEADEDFVDVLLSFLTMPMGTIITLIRSEPPTVGIGCMNNLYESIENLDVERLQTKACKTMLLNPRNAAAAECKRLKLKIDDGEPHTYFICNSDCALYRYKLLSHYSDATCGCGKDMNNRMSLTERACTEKVKGVFVKALARLIISDELEIMPASIVASLSLLSKQGVIDGTTVEECNLNIGVEEVLTLLKCSLVSKTSLTETLLKHNPVPELGKESCLEGQKSGKADFNQGSYIKSRKEEPATDFFVKICVKLIVSKSKNMVCFAEASEDFVDLLFSFLTVPLGCVLKEIYGGTSKGCITHLYNSAKELDAKQYLKSSKHKEILLSPKLAPNFGFENHPLGIEEDKHLSYYYGYASSQKILSYDKTLIDGAYVNSTLTVVDPKSNIKEAAGGGIFTKPANFTVTDNLIITPISAISCLPLLNELKVPFTDVEEHVVHVGTTEALRLLVTSFVSESALTDAFLREPKPEY